MILKMILIPMLVKTLLATRRPLLCAGLYSAALFTNSLIFDLAIGQDISKVVFHLAGATALSFAFFWLLKEFDSAGALYWIVLVLGTAAMLFFF